MASPMTIPRYMWRATVMQIPPPVDFRRLKAWVWRCVEKVVFVYCVLASAAGSGNGGTGIGT